MLRQRAATLQQLARSIEQSLVMALEPAARHEPVIPIGSQRARLCETMLARNLQQLHQAADDLRETALRFLARADDLERPRAA